MIVDTKYHLYNFNCMELICQRFDLRFEVGGIRKFGVRGRGFCVGIRESTIFRLSKIFKNIEGEFFSTPQKKNDYIDVYRCLAG